jgi:hypothetical protein
MTTTTNPIPASLSGLSRPEVVKHFAAGDTVSVLPYKHGKPVEGVLVSLDPYISENVGWGADAKRVVRKASKARRSYHSKSEVWNNSSVGFAVKVGDKTIVTKMVLGEPKAVRSLVRKSQDASRQARKDEAKRQADAVEQNKRIVEGLVALGLVPADEVDDDGTVWEASRSYRNSTRYEVDANILDIVVARAVAAQSQPLR